MASWKINCDIVVIALWICVLEWTSQTLLKVTRHDKLFPCVSSLAVVLHNENDVAEISPFTPSYSY